ncbi:serine/threonine-protein phosphatase [Kitasatospora sp. NA04385]|uniref:PP2C family protein-serine/threonine phosphatase n=1 Tax=Kitasatospora sp. NA04385 TaxID=2742135 RepID=UPI0015927DC2|nr:PP2C family protein-serine/threonine phosphatase [Kitasatospora sp. NA04385]QKW17955.1 serine/threonine-protein phosphatase [Kitasatospora sp. NA04385]
MGHDEEAAAGAAVLGLLEGSHRAGPRDVPGLVRDAARRLGLTGAWIYLADVQEKCLTALPVPPEDPSLTGPSGPGVLDVDNSLAGRAYRTESTCTGGEAGTGTGTDAGAGVGAVGWVPLVDGIGRLGVLQVTAPVLDGARLASCRALADATALLIAARTPFSDLLVRTGRRRPMTLQAELVRAFLPPRTIGSRRVTSSAVLEPAYDIGGDAFDHNLADRHLHLTMVDAMGHDLASGGSSAVAVAACRSTRRTGGTLADIAGAVDAALTRWIPDRLLTCVIADLDLDTGALSWINCGHPTPLLIRRGRIVPRALERPVHPPLGLPEGLPRTAPTVHTARLEPGDQLLVHSDGVTEGRDADGVPFGEERLVDVVSRAMADGLPAPEALRRLVRRVTAHQGDRLRDDATVLLAAWHPAGA